MSGRFAIIPAVILADATLPPMTLKVLLTLSTFADKDGWCWPRVGTLATRLEVHPRTVQRALDELKKRGYLEVTPWTRTDGSQSSNRYRIIYDLGDQEDSKTAGDPPPTVDEGGVTNLSCHVTEMSPPHDMLHVTPYKNGSSNTHTHSASPKIDEWIGKKLLKHPVVKTFLVPDDLDLEAELYEWELNNDATGKEWNRRDAAFCRWLGFRIRGKDYHRRAKLTKDAKRLEELPDEDPLAPAVSKFTDDEHRDLIYEWANLVIAEGMHPAIWNEHFAPVVHSLEPIDGRKWIYCWRPYRQQREDAEKVHQGELTRAAQKLGWGIAWQTSSEYPLASVIRPQLSKLPPKPSKGDEPDGQQAA